MNGAVVILGLIPRSPRGKSEYMQAKQTELEKLKDFDIYQVVPDTGRYRILQYGYCGGMLISQRQACHKSL